MPEDKKLQQDPVEGSREVIERQLKKQSSKTPQQTASESADDNHTRKQQSRDK